MDPRNPKPKQQTWFDPYGTSGVRQQASTSLGRKQAAPSAPPVSAMAFPTREQTLSPVAFGGVTGFGNNEDQLGRRSRGTSPRFASKALLG